MKGREQPQTQTKLIICGTSRKRPNPDDDGPPAKRRQPRGGARPVITMVLQWGKEQKAVWVLLDTGCSLPLINQTWVEENQVPTIRCKEPLTLENFTGQPVQGAGLYYTEVVKLSHRRHHTRETFEVSPMEKDMDIFLPFHQQKI